MSSKPEPSVRAYEAFRVRRVIDGLPGNQRIESLCCWQRYLLVGLQDGTILQCTEQKPGTWQVRLRRARWPPHARCTHTHCPLACDHSPYPCPDSASTPLLPPPHVPTPLHSATPPRPTKHIILSPLPHPPVAARQVPPRPGAQGRDPDGGGAAGPAAAAAGADGGGREPAHIAGPAGRWAPRHGCVKRRCMPVRVAAKGSRIRARACRCVGL